MSLAFDDTEAARERIRQAQQAGKPPPWLGGGMVVAALAFLFCCCCWMCMPDYDDCSRCLCPCLVDEPQEEEAVVEPGRREWMHRTPAEVIGTKLYYPESIAAADEEGQLVEIPERYRYGGVEVGELGLWRGSLVLEDERATHPTAPPRHEDTLMRLSFGEDGHTLTGSGQDTAFGPFLISKGSYYHVYPESGNCVVAFAAKYERDPRRKLSYRGVLRGRAGGGNVFVKRYGAARRVRILRRLFMKKTLKGSFRLESLGPAPAS